MVKFVLYAFYVVVKVVVAVNLLVVAHAQAARSEGIMSNRQRVFFSCV